MNTSLEILSARTTSAFSLSIGTSLSLESIAKGNKEPYDKDRPIPNQVNILDYSLFYINLFTLYRNILGAVPTKDHIELTPKSISDTLEQEVSIIEDVIRNESNNKTSCVFYVSKYSNLKRKHPHAIIRKDVTDRQVQNTQIMQTTLNEFIKTRSKDQIQIFDLELETTSKSNCLILTHFAYDLLSSNKFSKLDLIESHTGVLKDKSKFYTKLINGKELVRIPFNYMSMQVFGDSQTFHPMPSKSRSLVLDLAEKYQWHQGTTKDRIHYSINTLEDRLLYEVLKTMI